MESHYRLLPIVAKIERERDYTILLGEKGLAREVWQ